MKWGFHPDTFKTVPGSSCLSQETKETAHFEALLKQEIPLVFFDRVCLQDQVSCVTVDNEDAARRITRHFYKQGYRRIAFISGPPHPPPDAVFGINDTVAFAAMKEIKLHGLRIPKDIGLVGFTDEFHSTVVEPQLTSVTHPTLKMGKKAAELFFESIEKNGEPRTVVLKTKLVIRESSGG